MSRGRSRARSSSGGGRRARDDRARALAGIQRAKEALMAPPLTAEEYAAFESMKARVAAEDERRRAATQRELLD